MTRHLGILTATAIALVLAPAARATDAQLQAKLEIATEVEKVDQQALKNETNVATRLAGEFGMTVDALMAQKSDLDASWGELTIAHTLAANANEGTSVEQLFELRSTGEGWGQIASGLGLNLGQTVSAMRHESRVAAGLARPDGKPQTIARGSSVKADAGTRASLGLGHGAAGVGAATRIGAGVGLGATKRLGGK